MVTILCGSNSYALGAERHRLVSEFTKKYGDLALEKIDAEEADYGQIREAIENLPFLATKKMVLLKRPGLNKLFVANLEQLLGGVPKSIDVLIIEPQPDRRSSYYKILKSQAGFKEFIEPDERTLQGWLVRKAAAMGCGLSATDAVYLVGLVGANQQRLSNELSKLILLGPKIDRQLIDSLVVPTPATSIFTLLEAVFAGRPKMAVALYADQRAQKIEPPQIMSMLAWQVRLLALIRASGGVSVEQIARQTGLSSYSLKRSHSLAKRLELTALTRLADRLLALDESVKTKGLDADQALQGLILEISAT